MKVEYNFFIRCFLFEKIEFENYILIIDVTKKKKKIFDRKLLCM